MIQMVMKASDGREFPAEQADLAERYEALRQRGAALVGLEPAPRPIGLLLMDPFTGVATTELGERTLWAQELVKWWTDVLDWRIDWDAAVAREAGDKLVAFPRQATAGGASGDRIMGGGIMRVLADPCEDSKMIVGALFPENGEFHVEMETWVKRVPPDPGAATEDEVVVRLNGNLPPDPIGPATPERLGDVEACERLGEEARLRESLRQYAREIADRDGWAAHAAGRSLIGNPKS